MKTRVSVENYPREVLQSTVPVLVEFFALWCGKCAMMEDVLDEIAEEYYDRVKICQVEIDACEALTTQFEIEVVPTFVVFWLGVPVAAASGILDKGVLIDMIGLGQRARPNY